MKLTYISVIALAALLAGCSHAGVAVETQYKTITITKRGPCPDRATYAKLKASRPTPLRNQARPSTGTERVARTAAQLGLYEGEGQWGDQVSATLDRCQQAGEDTEAAEGVADKP